MSAVRWSLYAALLSLACAAPPALAHHSFAAQFDGSKPVRLVGFITRIEWTNPHSYFYLNVTDSKGQVRSWACESGAPGPLSRRGWKKGDLKFGDRLIVDGYLARDARAWSMLAESPFRTVGCSMPIPPERLRRRRNLPLPAPLARLAPSRCGQCAPRSSPRR